MWSSNPEGATRSAKRGRELLEKPGEFVEKICRAPLSPGNGESRRAFVCRILSKLMKVSR